MKGGSEYYQGSGYAMVEDKYGNQTLFGRFLLNKPNPQSELASRLHYTDPNLGTFVQCYPERGEPCY